MSNDLLLIYLEWNVVQITTMFRNYNRFARDVVAPRETPGLFLTSYSCPYVSCLVIFIFLVK